MNEDFEVNDYEKTEVYIEPVREMGIFEKLKYLFLAPSKTFENLKEYPTIWAAILITFILTIITGLVSINITNLINEKMLISMSQLTGIETPFVPASLDAKYIITMLVGTPLGLALSWLLGTFFLWLLNKIFGGKVNFSTMLSFQAHLLMFSSIIGLIAFIPQIIMNTDINLFSFAILNPNGDPSSFLYNILRSTSLTTIWFTVVTGIGLSIISGYDKTKGYIVSATYYILGILVSAGVLTLPFIIFNFTKNLIQ